MPVQLESLRSLRVRFESGLKLTASFGAELQKKSVAISRKYGLRITLTLLTIGSKQIEHFHDNISNLIYLL